MKLYLTENVYFVEGAVNSVLYDLNSNRLYHLNHNSSELVQRSLSNPSIEMTFTAEEDAFLNKLIEAKLLSLSSTPHHDITELAVPVNIDFVWIEVTTRCNLKCVHCYDESDANCCSVMQYDDFCHIIDELETQKIRKLQIIGGEPLVLGKSLMRYLDYCCGKFDYIEIFTNGTLLDDFWIQYLSLNRIRVALSVYSYLPVQHDIVTRTHGSWCKTNEAIKKLHDAGIKYRVKNVLMADLNLGERNTDLYELSSRKDIVRLTGRANLALLSRDLLRKKLITAQSFTGVVRKQNIARNISGHNCFSRRLYFAADCKVYPCVMERRILHGSIKNMHLSEIIDESILALNKNKITGCRSCEFRYSCFDCRPDSNGNGATDKPWYCTYSPELGVWQDPEKFIDSITKTI